MAESSGRISLTSEITDSDLAGIIEILCPVSHKYKFFGLQIKVYPGEIARIQSQYRGDPRDCLLEILMFRINQRPALTRADIAKALRSRSVGENGIADQIEGNQHSPPGQIEEIS